MHTASEKELMLIDRASAEFARKELSQIMDKNGTESFGPAFYKIVQKAWELDFFHILLPERIGGSELGYSTLCRILENICFEESSLSAVILTTLTSYETLMASGMASVVEDCISNRKTPQEYLIGFPLFSEFSENQIRVSAQKTADGYTLSGSADYIVLAGLAETAIIPARMEGNSGYCFFLTDLTQHGVIPGEPLQGLGITACPVCDIRFDKAAADCCGDSDSGERTFDQVSSRMSLALAAMQIGIMKGSFSDAMAYAGKRRQGGREIVKWSEVRKILSGMALNIQLAEMLVRQCCSSIDGRGKNWKTEAAATAAAVSEMANQVTTDGIQVMGGVGYMKDFHQERRFRDSRHLMSVFGIHQLKKLNFLERFVPKSAL